MKFRDMNPVERMALYGNAKSSEATAWNVIGTVC